MKKYFYLLLFLNIVSVVQCMIQRIDTSKKQDSNYLHIFSKRENNNPIVIDASNNQLQSLKEIEKYIKNPTLVRHIVADNNNIEEVNIDEILHKFPNLVSLQIQENGLTSIKCSELPFRFYLNISHNKLVKIPTSTAFAGCEGYIDLSGNYLSESECCFIRRKSTVPLLQRYYMLHHSQFLSMLKTICKTYALLEGISYGAQKIYQITGALDRFNKGESGTFFDNLLGGTVLKTLIVSKLYLFFSIVAVTKGYRDGAFSFHKSKPNLIKTHNQLARIPLNRDNESKGLKNV